MKIIVAGAGIGGLTAALCLVKAGHEVQVVEKAASFAETGAGIQCGANALRVMDYLGLLDEIKTSSVAPQRIEFCDYLKGDVLYTAPLGESYSRRYGAPYLHVLRADLMQVLLDAFQYQAPESLMFNAEVDCYEQKHRGVLLRLKDGRSIEADCLVGADGIRSKIRQQVIGQTKPEFTGNVAWRGVLDARNLPKNFMPRIARNFVGPNKHMVMYYLRAQKLVNFVAVVESQTWRDDSWTSRAPWEELKTDFEGWHPDVQLVIEAMDKQQCYRWALYDHEPVNNWSTDTVTLLGDAAHASLPFMASGAAMAIEDGRILQRALDQADSIGKGLKLYQNNRLNRTAQIQRDSRRLGRLYHLNNRLLLNLAFLGLSSIGKLKERRLPEYDANTVELKH